MIIMGFLDRFKSKKKKEDEEAEEETVEEKAEDKKPAISKEELIEASKPRRSRPPRTFKVGKRVDVPLTPDLETQVTSALRVPIQRQALEKAFAYIELIPRVIGSHEECYGHLLALEHDPKGIVVDLTLAPDQEVNSVHVGLNFDAVCKAGEEIKDTPYRIVGWWHSHQQMAVFFSSTDDTNIEDVLNSTMAYKQMGPDKVKYAYGLTLNERREYYAEIAIQKGHISSRTTHAEFLILEGGPVFDKAALGAEIRERIKTAKSKYWGKKAYEKPAPRRTVDAGYNRDVEFPGWVGEGEYKQETAVGGENYKQETAITPVQETALAIPPQAIPVAEAVTEQITQKSDDTEKKPEEKEKSKE
jgi:hypothetical protein